MPTENSAFKFSTFAATLILGLVATGLSGCEQDGDRQLAAGQACIDQAANAAAADQCVSMVQGLTSPQSYLIRCSADFVAQGFTIPRLANAFQSLKKNTGGNDPMIGLMAYLIFSNVTNHSPDNAIADCTASGAQSMVRLATAAKLATTIAGFGTVDPTSPNAADQLNTIIQSYTGTATQNAALGTTAIQASAAYCAAGGTYENTEVCVNLKNALAASTDPATIGLALITQLKTNSGH